MNIKQTAQEIHAINVEKGFWEDRKNIGEMLMLVTSELSEALEADREGKWFKNIGDSQDIKEVIENDFVGGFFKAHVKNTFEDEIADAVIRLLDIAEGLGIDLEFHIRSKMNYNKTRGYKHGKAY